MLYIESIKGDVMTIKTGITGIASRIFLMPIFIATAFLALAGQEIIGFVSIIAIAALIYYFVLNKALDQYIKIDRSAKIITILNKGAFGSYSSVMYFSEIEKIILSIYNDNYIGISIPVDGLLLIMKPSKQHYEAIFLGDYPGKMAKKSYSMFFSLDRIVGVAREVSLFTGIPFVQEVFHDKRRTFSLSEDNDSTFSFGGKIVGKHNNFKVKKWWLKDE
jgi:hypothetical protein